jgi:hypothetical protein
MGDLAWLGKGYGGPATTRVTGEPRCAAWRRGSVGLSLVAADELGGFEEVALEGAVELIPIRSRL